MLLEQATQVFKDMQAARVRPDATAWNSLIASAGRAGNLQRAQEVLEDMMVNFCRGFYSQGLAPHELRTGVQRGAAGHELHHVCQPPSAILQQWQTYGTGCLVSICAA